jgi:hypothetical protein
MAIYWHPSDADAVFTRVLARVLSAAMLFHCIYAAPLTVSDKVPYVPILILCPRVGTIMSFVAVHAVRVIEPLTSSLALGDDVQSHVFPCPFTTKAVHEFTVTLIAHALVRFDVCAELTTSNV